MASQPVLDFQAREFVYRNFTRGSLFSFGMRFGTFKIITLRTGGLQTDGCMLGTVWDHSRISRALSMAFQPFSENSFIFWSVTFGGRRGNW